MNTQNPFLAPLNVLLEDGLSLHDGVLWEQGDTKTTRPQARQLINTMRLAFQASNLVPGDRLALHAVPTPQSLSALIAALIDGIVIVPIDESLNNARKLQMLELANPVAMLDLTQDASLAPDMVQISLTLDSIQSTGQVPAQSAPSDPDAPSYIFFTSGSTGMPKPVLGRSCGLAHFIHWEKECLALSTSDRVSLLTRFSFDVILRDILLPLVSGCVSIMPKAGEPMAAQSMMDWIKDENITVLHTVPSVAHALLSASTDHTSLSSLHHTLFAGEPLTGSMVERWRARFPNSVVHNLYGPTETTLAKFHSQVPQPAPEGIQCCGAALPEIEFAIFKENGNVPELGELGEVAISTHYASLGYATRGADITPIVRSINGCDWYMTGDLGFVDDNGALHLRGRKDDQVKIMGVRLELAGIAALMEAHPLIEKAVVIAEEDAPDQKSLISWYVTAPNQTVTASDIRGFLADRCPPAGIPGRLIPCDTLPTTANGKIDKTRLPRPHSLEAAYITPETDAEIAIAAAFAQVLGLEKVGADADFFSLGGDSLAATAISISLADTLSCHVEPGMFLDAPTPRELAMKLQGDNQDQIAPIPAAPTARTFPLTPQQQRYFRTFCASGNRNWCNMVALFELPDRVTAFEVSNAVNDISLYHDSLRLAFECDAKGLTIQSISPTSKFELGEIDLSQSNPADLAKQLTDLKIEEGEAPIDVFAETPLFRASLVLLPDNKRKLLWNVHHLISDGTSQGIFARLLLEWFDNKQGVRAQWQDIPSFKDVAYFVNAQATELPDSTVFSNLLSRPDVYRHTYISHRHDVPDPQRCNAFDAAISPLTVELLRTRARTLKCTPYVVLLSSYIRFLGAMTESADIAIVTPLAGREHPQIRYIIGDFINLVSLRIPNLDDLDNNMLVAQVRDQVTEAARYQNTQFDQVIDALGLPFPADRNALTGFSLNYMPQGVDGPVPKRVHSDRGYKLKYDMLFLVRDFTNSLNIEIQYRTGLFNHAQIEDVFDKFEKTVIGMCYDS